MPQHSFNLRTPPFAIQPFMIAPVLAGETLKNLLLQARVVTDPVKNPLIGWWTEFYFFYVKLRDLEIRESLVEMLLDPAFDNTTIDAPTAAPANYHAGGVGQIDFVALCLDRVVSEYFRDEGQTANTWVLNFTTPDINWFTAQVMKNSVFDSVKPFASWTTTDVDVDTADANTTVQASEIELAMRQWEMLKMNNLQQMSFEDYLATFGIRSPSVELHRPELVRYVRDWSYPSNTIDPTNGTPRSAVSWSVAERADKDRFFKEPGFLFGVHCSRPKIYMEHQKGTFTGSMSNAYSWLPAMLAEHPELSTRFIADNVGPIGAINTDAGGYFFDVKDLLLYGEQFYNMALTEAKAPPTVAIPNATLTQLRYPDVQDVLELFVDTTEANLNYFVRTDGVVSLAIAGNVRDTSPRGGPANPNIG